MTLVLVLPALDCSAQDSEEYSHHFDSYDDLSTGFHANCDPNPFYGETTFSVETYKTSEVSLKIYNQMGFMIAEPIVKVLPAGNHEVSWDPAEINLRSGVYYARISSGDKFQLLKLRYIK